MEQENVIKTLTRETKKLFYGYKERLLPTSFLFVGSSGVGKTSLAKVISETTKYKFYKIPTHFGLLHNHLLIKNQWYHLH